MGWRGGTLSELEDAVVIPRGRLRRTGIRQTILNDKTIWGWWMSSSTCTYTRNKMVRISMVWDLGRCPS